MSTASLPSLTSNLYLDGAIIVGSLTRGILESLFPFVNELVLSSRDYYGSCCYSFYIINCVELKT